MAIPHAEALDVIDIRPLGARLRDTVTTSLIKTPAVQLMRVVLQAGAAMPEHHVQGTVTIQCMEGDVLLTTPSRTCNLSHGKIVVLDGGERHAVKAVSDSSLLVTLLLAGK